jgi:hypothetical protein
MKLIFNTFYNELISEKLMNTYIDVRYYNIISDDNKEKVFYKRIMYELNKKCEKLYEEYPKPYRKIINDMKDAYIYIMFFDDVRRVENFKSFDGMQDLVKDMALIRAGEFGIQNKKNNFEEDITAEVTSNMDKKEQFLKSYDSDDFSLNLKLISSKKSVYMANLEYKFDLPSQFSYDAIENVYNSEIIFEDRLEIEYILMNIVCLNDIIDNDNKDTYVLDFCPTLFNKQTKMGQILDTLDNSAIQEKVSLRIRCKDYIKYKEQTQKLINKGFAFSIIVDESIDQIDDVGRFRIFNNCILEKNNKKFDEIKSRFKEQDKLIII